MFLMLFHKKKRFYGMNKRVNLIGRKKRTMKVYLESKQFIN